MVPTTIAPGTPLTPTMKSAQPSGRTRLTRTGLEPTWIDQKHSIQAASAGLGGTSA
jgi:hypothetical protein